MLRLRFYFFLFLILQHLTFYSQNIFTDVTKESGINHIYNIFESGGFGGGVAVFDFDNDGFEDLYLAGGKKSGVLYKNNGDSTFSDVTLSAGLITNNIITAGATTADINRDGYIDLFVTTIAEKISESKFKKLAKNLLFLNNGNGTFRRATEQFKLNIKNFSTGATFGDINSDGYPDLFIGNYFKDFVGNLGVLNGFTISDDYKPGSDELYLNIEGKYFKNISYLLDGCEPGYGFGGVFSDVDNDGDLDLYLINDFGEQKISNQLLINEYPRLKFTNKSKEMNADSAIHAMGTAVGDYNNDGWMDYQVTNIFSGPLLVNRGNNEGFLDLSNELGVGIDIIASKAGPSTAVISWSPVFLDYDNDLDLDLFNSIGGINPPTMYLKDFLFENMGRVFRVSENSGIIDYGISRGTVKFDFDNDGDLDLFVVKQTPLWKDYSSAERIKSKLFRNELKNDNNWLKVSLNGNESTSRGLGARVKIVSGNNKLIREVDGGSSHISQNTSILHFGLGDLNKIDSLVITWPGGKKQILTEIPINEHINIDEIESKEKSFIDWLVNFFNFAS